MKHYRSSIPKGARERVVATYLAGPQKYRTNCTLNGKLVGVRYFHETGELSEERPLKNGGLHGSVYYSEPQGNLFSAEPYLDGLPHGVAKQFDDGKLIGAYTMKHGTGLDLWRGVDPEEGIPRLYEARYWKDGKLHGFEWWLNHEDQESLWQERHFWSDRLHGIERSWNPAGGGLRRGYPKYWVHDKQVTKRQYLRECAKDPTLPPFREKDNRPRRKFPPEVAVHCIQRAL